MTHPLLLRTHPMVPLRDNPLRDNPLRAYGTSDEGKKVAVNLCGPKADGIEIDDVVVTPTP